jgi:exopolysaccharide biosynthesis polyprenyl glycosylphosphotransferase
MTAGGYVREHVRAPITVDAPGARASGTGVVEARETGQLILSEPVMSLVPQLETGLGDGDTAFTSPAPVVDAAPAAASRSGRHSELIALATGDALAVTSAVWALHPRMHVWVPIVTMAAIVWGLRGLYSSRMHMSVLDDVPSLVLGGAVGFLAATLVVGTSYRVMGLVASLLVVLLVLTVRAMVYPGIRRQRCKGTLPRAAVIIGTGVGAVHLAERIRQRPETGLRVRGVLGADPSTSDSSAWSGDIRQLPSMLADGSVDTVIVGDVSPEIEDDVLDSLRSCPARVADVYVLPRLGDISAKADDQVWGVPLIKVQRGHVRTSYVVKRVFDVAFASVALVLVSPILLVAALAIRLDLGPGILFRQERIGRGGQPFELFKLRSMKNLAPDAPPEWAASTDRMGRVGAFIRRYSIDELPQLVNVLRGNMSLVGPRPERPEYVEQFGSQIRSYPHRHRAMVGLTGLAAVEGLRGDTSIDERAHFDNWYIDHWSFWLDLKILVRTGSALFKGTGA